MQEGENAMSKLVPSNCIGAFALLLAVATPALAQYDTDPLVNGLPCNSLCRWWLAIPSIHGEPAKTDRRVDTNKALRPRNVPRLLRRGMLVRALRTNVSNLTHLRCDATKAAKLRQRAAHRKTRATISSPGVTIIRFSCRRPRPEPAGGSKATPAMSRQVRLRSQPPMPISQIALPVLKTFQMAACRVSQNNLLRT